MSNLKRLFNKKPALTAPQKVEAERERRVTSRDRVDYSYSIFWTKNARLWDTPKRDDALQRVSALIQSPEFAANPYQRNYRIEGVEGSHSGASLIALRKVLEALRDQ